MSNVSPLLKPLVRPLTRAITEAGVGGGLPNTMTITVASGNLYARTAWDSTYDLVQRISVTSQSAGPTSNGAVNYTGARLIPVATARDSVVSAFNSVSVGSVQYLSQQGDDAPPLKYNSTYIGGTHGPDVAIKVTAVGHGKTTADIGSQWASGAANYYLIRVLDADNLWVIRTNSGTASLWSFNKTLAAPGTLTHVAGATNTANISFSSTTSQQIYPCTQDHTRTIKLNGVTPAASDGVYDCNFVAIEESYGVANPASLISFLVAGRPWASEPALNDSAIDTQVVVEYRHIIRDNGSMTVAGRFENLQSINLAPTNGYAGFAQAGAISWVSSGGAESLSLYAPRVSPIVGGLKTWNLENGEVISGAFETLTLSAATWKEADNPPDRMVQFVKETSGGTRRRGFVIGYSRLSGDGINAEESAPLSFGFINASRKMYPSILTDQAFGSATGSLPLNTVVEAEAYRVFYDLADTPEATVAAVRLFTGGAEVILDFHEDVAGYAVAVPTKLNGKAVSIVASNGNLTLDSATVVDGEILVTTTGGYASANLLVSA